MALPFSLSTSWNGLRHQDPAVLLAEVRELGFDRIEAYGQFTPAELRELGRRAGDFGVTVTSLHSPCPVPLDGAGARLPWSDWLASTDEPQRRFAVDVVKRTIDSAAELGARAVVVHLGNSGAPSRQREIFEVIRQRGRGSPEHLALVRAAREERERTKAPAFDAAVRSALELGEHARGTGVWIGLECRDGYVEIPSLDEFALLFQVCADLPVGYWHDAGHAQKLDNAGFVEHEEYLRRYAGRLVGMHLHDTRLDRDHQAPGQGETDFELLARYDRPGLVRTLELSASVPASQIRPGAERLLELGLGRQP